MDPYRNRAKCSFTVTVQSVVGVNNRCREPGQLVGGHWVCSELAWGRMCRPACRQGFVMIKKSSSPIYICSTSTGLWTPSSELPACTPTVSFRPSAGCLPGFERRKTHPDVCLACTPGMHRSSRQRQCTPCPLGTYTDNFASQRCKQCADGSTTAEPGANSNALCLFPVEWTESAARAQTEQRKKVWEERKTFSWT
ncbi:signal peptide, CUB and EGF-like domain-containing protein 3 isoform X3 [Penaeus chinensis]|uniref:signal peptide, CUB and EGF-like domain-containing protein 3 isoform X3 n=1 Tax=Penaeus chinensis TaxID=139456 RepID=UPI001FB704E8|nr:signal peptide, CUB and EGF-like domain-containing protein 3 isoform X3 [Penaeus chinensis]